MRKTSKSYRVFAGKKAAKNNRTGSRFSLSPAEEMYFAVKTICGKYDLSQDELVAFSELEIAGFNILDLSVGVRFVRKFPIDVPTDGETFSLFQISRSTVSKFDVGIGEYNCYLDGDASNLSSKNKVQFWVWKSAQEYCPIMMSAFFIRKSDWYRLFKYFSRKSRQQKIVDVPILPKNVLSDLYNNSIGFLMKGQKAFNEYGIPFKRGIIIQGPPGCGKSLSCRWIKQLCAKHNFHTKIVTLQEYKHAVFNGRVDLLFSPFYKKKGIVFFDDLDLLLTDRKTGNIEVSNFLSGLDGIDVREGTVCIFTTNEIEGLDKAAIRPNRIDLFVRLINPNPDFRTEFINKKFPQEVLEHIDIASLSEQTNDFSFAELEEVRRLFCIDLIESREIKLDRTLAVFKEHRKEFPAFPSIGFKTGDLDDCGSPPLPYLPYPGDDESRFF